MNWYCSNCFRSAHLSDSTSACNSTWTSRVCATGRQSISTICRCARISASIGCCCRRSRWSSWCCTRCRPTSARTRTSCCSAPPLWTFVGLLVEVLQTPPRSTASTSQATRLHGSTRRTWRIPTSIPPNTSLNGCARALDGSARCCSFFEGSCFYWLGYQLSTPLRQTSFQTTFKHSLHSVLITNPCRDLAERHTKWIMKHIFNWTSFKFPEWFKRF